MNEPPMMIAARAEQAMREGRLTEAVTDLVKLKSLVPEDPMVHLMWAFAHRGQGKIGEAVAGFEKALELSPNDIGIRGQFASWLDDIGDYETAVEHYDHILKLQPNHLEAQIDRALALARSNRHSEGVRDLKMIAKLNGGALRAWSNLAILLREDQQYDEAEAAARHILSRDPAHPRAHHIIAQCAYEQGKPASKLFVDGRKKAPDDLRLVGGQAAALIQEGSSDEALDLLDQTLVNSPEWAHGHNILADYRWQFEGQDDFARSFDAALKEDPKQTALWSDLITLKAGALGHEAALTVIDQGRSRHGDDPLFDLLEANSRSELGEFEKAGELFDSCNLESSSAAMLYYVRHLAKAKQFDQCAKQAMEMVEKGYGGDAWPYVSTAWRMLDDPRWEWLEGNEALIQSFDLDGMTAKLSKLAAKLRELHKFNVRPIGQSLRDGTQTEAALFSNQAPIIQSLVKHIRGAVEEYLEKLPAADAKHPLLGMARDSFRFTGSWSVRLTGAGFHVNHIHNHGSISSAFYVALPDGIGNGKKGAHDGWLAFGEPAAELDTGLPPIRMIEPKPGRLALFPSTMWHGTRPFGDGERLTCAFDVGLLNK